MLPFLHCVVDKEHKTQLWCALERTSDRAAACIFSCVYVCSLIVCAQCGNKGLERNILNQTKPNLPPYGISPLLLK